MEEMKMTVLDELQEKLINEWDQADEATKIEVLEKYNDIGEQRLRGTELTKAMRELRERYGQSGMDLIHKTSEEIHKANVKAAAQTVKNLIQRVEKKIGTITDATDVYTDYDNHGFVVLNGWFRGENGKQVEVRSIRAGGYNIQKMHIRVLVL